MSDEEKKKRKSYHEIKLELIEYMDEKFEKQRSEINDKTIIKWRWIYSLLGLFVICTVIGVFQGYYWGVAVVQEQVEKRMDEEFTPEKMKKRIDEKLNLDFSAHTTRLNNIFALSVFADSANYGSRSAYNMLQQVAQERSDFSIIAKGRLMEVERNLQIYKRLPQTFSALIALRNNKEIPIDSISIEEIIAWMERPSFPESDRQSAMVYVIKRPREEVFKNAINVLRTSPSLPTCAAINGILIELLGNRAEFLDFNGWIRVLESELEKMKEQ